MWKFLKEPAALCVCVSLSLCNLQSLPFSFLLLKADI